MTKAIERAALLLETYAQHGMLPQYEDGRKTENALLAEEVARDLRALLAGQPTHVICFGGEGAQVILCYGWDDCTKKFFDGILGPSEGDKWGHEPEIAAWLKDFEDDDHWALDEDRKRYCFRSDIGEISNVQIFVVAP